MKYAIEITWMTPKIDPATLQMVPGIIMAYKSNNKYEQMELGASMMEVMQMLAIQNLTDAVWKKYEIEVGDDKKLKSMVPIDTRVIGYADFEKLDKKMNEILNLLRKSPDPKTQP